MLAQLRSDTEADEDVLVTPGRPHWAHDALPVRDVEGAVVESAGGNEDWKTGSLTSSGSLTS